MPVYLKENDQKKYLKGKQLVPQVSDLFIDKLYITFNLPKEQQQKAIDTFLEAEDNGWLSNAFIKKSAYTHNWYMSTDNPIGDGAVLFQCKPKAPSHNFLRIEFNPAKADLASIKTFFDQFVPGGYSDLVSKGTCNRIDLTVDVSFLDATEIIASYPKMKTEKHIGKGGKTESKYLGATGSNKQIVIYDKRAETIAKNKKKPAGLKKPVPKHKLLRVEMRLLKLGKSLKELVGLENPLKDLTLIAFPGVLSADAYDPTWKLFLRVCDNEGTAAALSYLSGEDKKLFEERLKKEGRTDWWMPEKIWLGLSATIQKLIDVQGLSLNIY